MDNFLKEGNFSQAHFPLIVIEDNPFTALLKLLEENGYLQIALVGDNPNEKIRTHSTHLYFLFPTYRGTTSDKETYSIVLHIINVEKSI
ncbi:hypothetical protein [Candidatus Paracaedibacter symbiosus]|uniref:hypothetical protein n=1 Tax=Candidatus Paracaedibacter symbiosus TaxID=244582 RepID=UPI000509C73B|nr:hypothetical protein [Candidatus Paracaedibacter symbiosus]